MTGRFTRLNYDPDTYTERVQISTKPLLYTLDPTFAVNCNTCFAKNGPRFGRENSIAAGDMTDIDSILKGISKISTKSAKYKQPPPLHNYQLSVQPDCSSFLEPEYTRYTHPAYDVRGLTTPDMNFDYPHHDPQCNIFEDTAVNTRLQAKDNHRAVWQTPLNQQNAFPVQRPSRKKNCVTSTFCAYAPFE